MGRRNTRTAASLLGRLLRPRVAAGAVALGCTLLLGGCGSSAKVESRSTTTGQELQDLDDARNKGLLTEDEYNKKRSEILKKK